MKKCIYISSLILLLAISAQSQSLYNQGATISITENTIFTVEEDAFNNGLIINNGNFLISGTWINNGNYDPGMGDFTLNSPNEQIVNHQAQSFQRLVIRGGGPKIFRADLSIDNTLELVDGVMISENNSRLLVEEGATIVGGSETSYIAGPLYLPSSSAMFFPIGNETTYLPIEFSNINGDATTTGFEVVSPNPISEVDAPEIETVVSEYAWRKTDLNGSSGEGDLTLPIINQSSNLELLTNVVVLGSPDMGTPYLSFGSTNTSGDLDFGNVTARVGEENILFSLGEFTNDELPDITVYNAVTVQADGMHDFLRIENIELYPNEVRLFDRWGNLVWEQDSYSNSDPGRRFAGTSNINDVELKDGTYYYLIIYGGKTKSGFFVLRR